MNRSQYYYDYLNTNASRPGRELTVATFFTGLLRGRAATFVGRYVRSLTNSLERGVAAGEVERVRSARGKIAYRRTAETRA